MAPLSDAFVEHATSPALRVRFKCELAGSRSPAGPKELRRFSLPLEDVTIEAVKIQAAELFGLSATSCFLRLIDDEGDPITVTRTHEITEWLTTAEDSSRSAAAGVNPEEATATTRLIIEPRSSCNDQTGCFSIVGSPCPRVDTATPRSSRESKVPIDDEQRNANEAGRSCGERESHVVPSNPFAILERAFNLLIPTFPARSVNGAQSTTQRVVPALASQLAQLAIMKDGACGAASGGVDVRALVGAAAMHSAELYALALDPDHASQIEVMLCAFADAVEDMTASHPTGPFDDSPRETPVAPLITLLRNAAAWCTEARVLSPEASAALSAALDSSGAERARRNGNGLHGGEVTDELYSDNLNLSSTTSENVDEGVPLRTPQLATAAADQTRARGAPIDETVAATPAVTAEANVFSVDQHEGAEVETATTSRAGRSSSSNSDVSEPLWRPKLELVEATPLLAKVAPGEAYVQSWEVRNTGSVSVGGIALRAVGHQEESVLILSNARGDSGSGGVLVFDASLDVGGTGILTLDVRVPESVPPGSQHTLMLEPFEEDTGLYIGNFLQLTVNVVGSEDQNGGGIVSIAGSPDDQANETTSSDNGEIRRELQLLKELANLGFNDVTRNRQLLRDNDMDANRVALILMRDSSVDRVPGGEPMMVD